MMKNGMALQYISRDCGDVVFEDVFVDDLFVNKDGILCKKKGHDGSYVECHPTSEKNLLEDKNIKKMNIKEVVII